jgi:SpoVK/Ycf46/Vps4 family AAA+-type ATPase
MVREAAKSIYAGGPAVRSRAAERRSHYRCPRVRGKSLAARAIAAEWGIDLVRLDPGTFYDKYVGESEKRVRKTLELAQKLAPTVLWIDEIEKAFASGGTSNDADTELSQRLLAILLMWMQDRESGVFLAARRP